MMGTIEEIRQLIKNKVVIRHRTIEELVGGKVNCIICGRELVFQAGALCMVIDNEGLLCPVCGELYAPEMTAIIQGQVAVLNNMSKPRLVANQESTPAVSQKEFVYIQEEIKKLLEATDSLAKGVARGIIEAPAGHIGLMHYAKDIFRPERRDDESEKDYELRVRTFRISRLYEKIYTDTTGRIKRIIDSLKKIGLPFGE
jgi:hypothetical protein